MHVQEIGIFISIWMKVTTKQYDGQKKFFLYSLNLKKNKCKIVLEL